MFTFWYVQRYNWANVNVYCWSFSKFLDAYCCCSSSISLRPCRVLVAAGLRVDHGGIWAQVNCRGYRCWIARSRLSLLVLSLATLTMPSLPLIRSLTIASFHWLWFFFSSCIMTISPMLGWGVCSPPAQRWLSRRSLTYSAVHFFHITSLPLRWNFALFLKSLSSTW